MTNICAQLKRHFPITSGESLLYQSDFSLPSAWNFDITQIDHEFEPAYQQTQLPLDQRIVWKNSSTCIIDQFIRLNLPTPLFTQEAIEFWKGRKVVALLTAVIGGILIPITIIAIKCLAPLISSTSLIFGFGSLSAILTVGGIAFVILGLVAAQEARTQLNRWNQIEVHVPKLIQFSEKVARIRTAIFQAYRDGQIVTGEAKQHLFRYIDSTEIPLLLSTAVEEALPDATDEEKAQKLLEEYDSIPTQRQQLQHSNSSNIWDYNFPEITIAPLT